MAKEKRGRRLRADQSRTLILEAAEGVLLRHGPTDLKLERIADECGISISTVHHHFGGIQGIQQALIERLLKGLKSELGSALMGSKIDSRQEKENLSLRVFQTLAQPRYNRLIAWLVLSAKTEHLVEIAAPVSGIRDLLISYASQYFAVDEAGRLVDSIMYRVAISAVGEGLVGDILRLFLTNAPEGMDLVRALNVLISEAETV